jgi:hypothetical protein
VVVRAPGRVVLADDNEVLVRGESIMAGYRGQPGAARDVIDRDWSRRDVATALAQARSATTPVSCARR